MAKKRRKSRVQREEERQAAEKAEAARAAARVPADPSQMVIPANSHFTPPAYYEDVPFTCRSCDTPEVWTAADQKWWYEVAKGSIYAGPVLCLACRQAQRQAHAGTPRRSHADRRTGTPPDTSGAGE
jgi:hypothetical protein